VCLCNGLYFSLIPAQALELLLYYFIASEVGIANYIQRVSLPRHDLLFVDEIPHATNPHRTAFFLGAKDMILDASVRHFKLLHGTLPDRPQRVRLYLERRQCASAKSS
jgi:hypothetical protein